MSLLKERLELREKLEGKLAENTTIKKEQKRVSRLVIPQKFLFTKSNIEDQSKSLSSPLSKSTGNISSSHPSRKLSASLFKSNSTIIEADRVSLGPERKLSSKSFSAHLQRTSESFDDATKPSSRPKSSIEDTSVPSNSSSSISSSTSSSTSTNTPVIVGSIPKDSLSEIPTPDELANIISFVRSPKPAKKEEASTVLHFNFAAKPDALTAQGLSPNLRKIPSLHRSGSRCAILVPNEDIPDDNMKKSDAREEEIYVNIDIIRRYYDSATRIKCGPIQKLPVPSIRYSLFRKCGKSILV